MIKHSDIFDRCLKTLREMFEQLAIEMNISSSANIMSHEGLEQVVIVDNYMLCVLLAFFIWCE